MSEFPPGHRALGLQKLPLARFRICAWVSRTNAPGAYAVGPVWDRPLREKGTASISAVGATLAVARASFGPLCRGGPMRPPAGRRGRRPLRKGRSVSIFCRGGCQPPESLPPLRGKVPPKGADEGAFLACTLPGGRPKGLPYSIPEEFLESRRGGRLPLSRGVVAQRQRG